MLDLKWIDSLMRGLASRPIFHNEADFQQQLVRLLHGSDRVKNRPIFSEYPLLYGENKNRSVDIWFEEKGVAIELKYHTEDLQTKWFGECFQLIKQSKGPQLRYDFMKDVEKLEEITDRLQGAELGFAILLTNDRLIWDPSKKATVVDPDFRLHECDEKKRCRQMEGTLKWACHSMQLKKGPRKSPICLSKGPYQPKWKPYSDLKMPNGEFRYLAFQVPSPSTKGA